MPPDPPLHCMSAVTLHYSHTAGSAGWYCMRPTSRCKLVLHAPPTACSFCMRPPFSGLVLLAPPALINARKACAPFLQARKACCKVQARTACTPLCCRLVQHVRCPRCRLVQCVRAPAHCMIILRAPPRGRLLQPLLQARIACAPSPPPCCMLVQRAPPCDMRPPHTLQGC